MQQLLTGTFLLVHLTVFEFILAQSPHNMQGLLMVFGILLIWSILDSCLGTN